MSRQLESLMERLLEEISFWQTMLDELQCNTENGACERIGQALALAEFQYEKASAALLAEKRLH